MMGDLDAAGLARAGHRRGALVACVWLLRVAALPLLALAATAAAVAHIRLVSLPLPPPIPAALVARGGA